MQTAAINANYAPFDCTTLMVSRKTVRANAKTTMMKKNKKISDFLLDRTSLSLYKGRVASLAQLVEQLIRNQQAKSSSLLAGSILVDTTRETGCFFCALTEASQKESFAVKHNVIDWQRCVGKGAHKLVRVPWRHAGIYSG